MIERNIAVIAMSYVSTPAAVMTGFLYRATGKVVDLCQVWCIIGLNILDDRIGFSVITDGRVLRRCKV